MRRSALGLALAALTLPVLAACGSSGTGSGGIPENSPSASASATETSAAPAETANTTGKKANCDALGGVPAFPGTWGVGPTIPAGKGTAPDTLKKQDCLVGTGSKVTDPTITYLWNYTGVLYKNGKVFDSSFAKGQPIPFALNQVIPGWTKGLEGMKIGGRRELVIPPDQGYGAAGYPPDIPPNSTLVFVVDLVGTAPATTP